MCLKLITIITNILENCFLVGIHKYIITLVKLFRKLSNLFCYIACDVYYNLYGRYMVYKICTCCAGKLPCKTITEISNDQSFLKNILQLFYNYYCVN